MWLAYIVVLSVVIEGPIQQPTEGPALQPEPAHLSAETAPVSQQAQLSAWQPGPAQK